MPDGVDSQTGQENIPDSTGDLVGTESSLSNWAGPYVTDMLGKGWALSDMDYSAYEGPLTAAPSALQDQAFGGIAGLALPDSSQDAAASLAGLDYGGSEFDFNRWDNDFATQYMNPYIQQALNPMLDEQRRQAEIQRVNDAGRLTKAGAFGGSRQAIMESELTDNMLRQMADITGSGYRDAYDRAMGGFQTDEDRRLAVQRAQGQDNQFGAGFGLDVAREQADLGSSQLRDQQSIYDQMLSAGATDRDIWQQGLDADRGQFEEERDFPYRQTQFMQSLLQKLPLEAQQRIYTTPSLFETLLSGAGGGSELLNILGGLFGGEGGEGGEGGGATGQDMIDGLDTLRNLGII